MYLLPWSFPFAKRLYQTVWSISRRHMGGKEYSTLIAGLLPQANSFECRAGRADHLNTIQHEATPRPEPAIAVFKDRQREEAGEMTALSLAVIVVKDVKMANNLATDSMPIVEGSSLEPLKVVKKPWSVRMLRRKAHLAQIAQIVAWSEDMDE